MSIIRKRVCSECGARHSYLPEYQSKRTQKAAAVLERHFEAGACVQGAGLTGVAEPGGVGGFAKEIQAIRLHPLLSLGSGFTTVVSSMHSKSTGHICNLMH